VAALFASCWWIPRPAVEGHVLVVPGGHDWTTWDRLWAELLARGAFPNTVDAARASMNLREARILAQAESFEDASR
jgi:hypothetical protein